MACAWLYTCGPYPLSYNGLGDVFVVLFFGFVAVGCSYYVQAGTISSDVLLLGLGCGALVNNLLVVNNYRDLEEDRAAQKRTLVVIFGRRAARVQYQVSVLLAGLVVLKLWINGYGAFVLPAFVPIVHAMVLGRSLGKVESAEGFLNLLKGSSKVVLAYGVLFSVGLVLSRLV